LNTNVISDIWTKDEEGRPHLIGSKCLECDHLSFPAKEVCPYCMTNGRSNRSLIGRNGKVVSATICHTAPKGIQAPYTFGIVEIEGGVHVLARIDGHQIRKGDFVQLVIYPGLLEEQNEEVFNWKYEVVEGANA
jgi:uncharacterized OB-fold protein